MSPAPPFTSPLGPVFTQFLALKRALGRGYAREEAVLRALDTFLAQPPADLTAATFAAWGQTLQRLTPTVRRNWLRIARMACLYRHRTLPGCFVPDPALFPAPHHAARPFIFSAAQVAGVLKVAEALPPASDSPLQAAAYRLGVVLLYTLGLRRGELLRLTVGDYDAPAQTLRIRPSKFHKARCLPLGPDGVAEIARYLATRRTQGLSVAAELPLVWGGTRRARPYTGEGFAQGFRRLCLTAGIHTPAGRQPRVHDLRHTFAVHALLRWYAAGVDVQAKLPLLATYLGHVSIASTALYLPFVASLSGAANARFAERYGALVAAPGGAG